MFYHYKNMLCSVPSTHPKTSTIKIDIYTNTFIFSLWTSASKSRNEGTSNEEENTGKAELLSFSKISEKHSFLIEVKT